MYILNTDILLDVLKGNKQAIAWFSTLTEVPMITYTVFQELMEIVRNQEQVHQMFQLIAPLPIIWPTREESAKASAYYPQCLSYGLGSIDAEIAVCAIERSATLCTLNVKKYQVIPNLKVIKPYGRSVKEKTP
jgi:tRNA(fMet)-specific endonuclease VapC